MAKLHNGYKDIKVTLIQSEGNDLAKKVYEFGRFSHDYNYTLTEKYDENNEDCVKLIKKIVDGTTLPKFAMEGVRFQFKIENISRICLAQLTRDSAIFASSSTGVFPLTQDFNIPMSIYNNDKIMDKLSKAQNILEEAYIIACEEEIPSIEARYIGLHCQNISLNASYNAKDFVRSCYSRTSSNFCDECNYVYRLMYKEIVNMINLVSDKNSILLYNWLFPEKKCINDGYYNRERLFNSDFTQMAPYEVKLPALNNWLKSGWKMELERMYDEGNGYLTEYEKELVEYWESNPNLLTTYDGTANDVVKNMIKTMDYYKEVSDE